MKSFADKFFVLALALVMIVSTTACTKAQVENVVKQIVAYTPTAIALAQQALTLVNAFGASAVPTSTVAQITSKLTTLETVGNTYLSKSATASEKNVAWTSIITLVDSVVSDADSALLTSVGVKNSSSQQEITIGLGALSAALHIIDGYISTAQSSSDVQAKLAKRAIKLKTVSQFWTEQQKIEIAQAYGCSGSVCQAMISSGF